MVTIKQLLHALALERHGNFHRAAKAENISQPALSRSISALEESLGVPLFNRHGGSVTPTLYGEAVVRRAASAIGETKELLREIQLLRGLGAGNLRIATGVYPAEMSASRAAGELIARHPGLHCRLKLTNWKEVADLVASRSVDLGIAEISTLEDVAGLVLEPVGRHRLAIFCRKDHPLAGREPLSLADLAAYPSVTPRLPPRAVELLSGRTRLDKATGELLPSIEVDDFTSARIVVANSEAFGIATPLQIEPWLLSGELRALSFEPPWLELNYGFIYWRDRMLSPAAEVYMQLVRRIEQEVHARNEALMAALAILPGTVQNT